LEDCCSRPSLDRFRFLGVEAGDVDATSELPEDVHLRRRVISGHDAESSRPVGCPSVQE
jgi:hypothetical protein